MLPIYICEDSLSQLKKITKIIENYIIIENLDMKVVCAEQNPYSLIQYLESHKEQSLYFLDIDLKCDIDGFELSKKIRHIDPRGFIVFITTHSEMAMLTFQYQVEAMNFIIKDDIENFNGSITKCLIHAYELYITPSDETPRMISVKIGERIVSLQLDKIIVIESIPLRSHYIRIIGDGFLHELYFSLNEIIKQLDSSFYRCSKFAIVNMDKIIEIDKKDRIAHLQNDVDVQLSIRNCNKFINDYMDYKKSK